MNCVQIFSNVPCEPRCGKQQVFRWIGGQDSAVQLYHATRAWQTNQDFVQKKIEFFKGYTPIYRLNVKIDKNSLNFEKFFFGLAGRRIHLYPGTRVIFFTLVKYLPVYTTPVYSEAKISSGARCISKMKVHWWKINRQHYNSNVSVSVFKCPTHPF